MRAAARQFIILGVATICVTLAPVAFDGQPGGLYYPAAAVGAVSILVGIVLWFLGRKPLGVDLTGDRQQ